MPASNAMTELRKLGPLKGDDARLGCLACGEPFRPGDYYTLRPLGPGASPVQRKLARDGMPYRAEAVPVHWACATGEE